MTAESKTEGESLVSATIAAAKEMAPPATATSNIPRLLVERSAPDRTVATLRDILAATSRLFDRGVPVRLVHDQAQKGAVAQFMTPDGLILLTHQVCRPYVLKEKDGALVEQDVQLPRPFAAMYLDWKGEWNLLPLNGIASAPLLSDDGTILSGQGYDPATGMWRERLPDLSTLVPPDPSPHEADQALKLLRQTFRTFCFADAKVVEFDGMQVVDIDAPPGRDESAFLAALLTAVCRPSLDLAPAVLIRAAPMSGAGAGKGLLPDASRRSPLVESHTQ